VSDVCPDCGLRRATRFGGFGCAAAFGEPYSHACVVRVRDKQIAALQSQLSTAEQRIRELELDSPRSTCAVCGCRVSLAMNPPYEPDLKQGYRCTDCEQPFCAVCIKSDKHTTKWKAPCRDDELEAWAKAVDEHPKLTLRIRELEREVEAWRKLAEWEASNQNHRVKWPWRGLTNKWFALVEVRNINGDGNTASEMVEKLDSAQAAAIALAETLGLLSKADTNASEGK
jgi:hypothetical protein